MKFLFGFLAAIVLLALGGLALIYSGIYNVAASRPHNAFVYWVTDTTMHNSVARRAADIVPPERFTDEQRRFGFGEFSETCVHCHGGPGVGRQEWAKGLQPEPPDLAHAAGHWSSSELFWIVKHGIKATGMPAIGEHHDDAEIWSIVAFIEALPSMTPEAYRQMGSDSGNAATDG